ncbi:nucleotidyltransferase domain-containing protein [bacterium]|nr:nucleotidyltransferase domain-containing protein [bacterium]
MANSKTQEVMDEIVRRIASQFNPDKIILFGSHARGTAMPESDADLLVVMPIHGSRRNQATLIDLALVGVDMPVDILVATPEDVERDCEQIGTVIYPAVNEGKVLYERAA